jgi:hypothetical protein
MLSGRMNLGRSGPLPAASWKCRGGDLVDPARGGAVQLHAEAVVMLSSTYRHACVVESVSDSSASVWAGSVKDTV